MIDLSQEYNQVANQADSLDEALSWMNDRRKRMRDLVDEDEDR
jgi:hypothetical protein